MKEYKSYIEEISLVREPSNYKKVKITNSKDVYEYVKPFFKNSIDVYESAFCILLNRANNSIGWFKVSQGGIAGTFVDVKLVAIIAVKALASGVILCHNHPSGHSKPSGEDIKLTNKIKEGLLLLDIQLLDHIIITKDEYYSISDNN
jgi:DNA repair protein RadC